MIEQATRILLAKEDLAAAQMTAVMEEIMGARADTPQIVAFLAALSDKGESVEELVAAVRVMRRHAQKVSCRHELILDTCGTGGDQKGTFNISTVTAFVVSACGVAVAKHGNRSVSSKSGSADILEALGVNINMSVEKMQKCLDEIGIAFLFAQSLHPAMKFAAEARKEIARRTIFNLLGPLSNPAGATHQLIGVFERRWTRPLAEVLAALGTVHALVVHGSDGLDEVTISGPTYVSESSKGGLRDYQIDPEEFGFKKAPLRELQGKDAAYNAEVMLGILKGRAGAKRDIVLLNSAVALFAADKAASIKAGVVLAAEAIDSGKALGKLDQLKECSRN